MYHSNAIEGLWGELKSIIRHIYYGGNGGVNYEDFVWEAVWRRELRKKPNYMRSQFIKECYAQWYEQMFIFD